MKTGILIGICTLLSLISKAQESHPGHPDKTRELGLNLYTCDFNEMQFLWGQDPSFFEHFAFNGVTARFTKKRHALRLAANYYQRSYAVYQTGLPGGDNYTLGRNRSIEWRSGYQFYLAKGLFSPYLFTDLGIAYQNQLMRQECAACNFITTPAVPVPAVWWEPKVITGAGIKMLLTERFVVNAECNYQFIRYVARDFKYMFKGSLNKTQVIQLSVGRIF